MADLFDSYPYAERYAVNRTLPMRGRSREEILAELRTIASEEDVVWQSGGCSGTMYCGDHEHYAFLAEAFGLFAHQNALQRDMCPSATRFEGEIIAMALDLFHAGAVTDGEPAGMVTSGGTASITHAMLTYREHGREARGIAHPNVIKPETAHPAFDKACHLFGIELRRVPVDPDSTLVRPGDVEAQIDEHTVAIIGSAGNYGYGTIDPIAELAELALDRGIGLHVDGCLGGFLLPFGEELGYPIAPFDFRVPGVTSISADTHKYGYGLKGTSTVLFRDRALRNRSYFFMADWSGGKYFSPGMEGSRSDGLLAATWASLVSLGRDGYRAYAKGIFDTSATMQAAVRSHPQLRLLGEPTFLFAFASDEFDIYHVNDEMKRRGWRFNGLQYPNALHMAVTRPQLQPGVTDKFAADLAAAVRYATEHRDEAAASGAIYGGVPGGLTLEADQMIRAVMTQLLDAQQGVPAPA
ncbi:MAG TPA: aminotransferase class V-fold PLP-dependent enzyme [Solirubrobacteraceae bacterium]|nr:aminotransferase class V-fold PLP-dependent enzyme [Solirubrobacteraceae bacterium]